MPAKIHWRTRSGLPTKQVGSLSIQRNSNWNFPAENRVFQKNMNLTDYIARIRTHLLQTHADVIAWFAEGEHLELVWILVAMSKIVSFSLRQGAGSGS